MKEKEGLAYLKEHGIDADAGMRYADTCYEFYGQLISIFIEEYQEKRETAEKEAKKEGREYTVLVHGLKNNAKALGAFSLSEIAYEHEKASKAGDRIYILEHLEELLTEWKKTVEIFKKINN